MSRTTIRSRLEELERRLGMRGPRPRDFVIAFVRSDSNGGMAGAVPEGRLLFRAGKGIFRLPAKEEEPT